MAATTLIDAILAHPDVVRPPNGNGEAKAWCPWHLDKAGGNPSLGINAEKRIAKCFVCGQGGLRRLAGAWGISDSVHLLRNTRTSAQMSSAHCQDTHAQADTQAAQADAQVHGLTLQDYAEAKRLPLDFLRTLGIHESTYRGQTRLAMPYPTLDGSEGPVRYRRALSGGLRFAWRRGSHPILYGLIESHLRLAREVGHICVAEGESDTQTLFFHSLPALGVPGAANLARLLNESVELLDGIAKLYVFIEPDQGGKTFLEQCDKLLPELRERVRLVHLDGFKDVSEMHTADPDRFTEQLEAALAVSKPWADHAALAAQRAISEAWDVCHDIAQSPDILARFGQAVAQHAIAGDTRIPKIIFLAVASRQLRRPVSLAVKGPSSAGKSYSVEKCLDFFPSSAWYTLTAMSERALAYSTEPLKNRFIVIFEGSGLESSGFAAYMMRSLLSEGRLRYETVESTDDGLTPRLIEREGPTGLITTTTKVSLDRETETRLLTLTVEDTPEQTVTILERIALEDESEPVDLAPWHAFAVWLDHQTAEATVPFGKELARLVPPIAVRLRRDFGAVLALVRTHALLHQATRQKDERDRVIACPIHDYGTVRDLVANTLAEGVEASVPGTIRQTVDAVRQLIVVPDGDVEHKAASVSSVAKRLGIDRSAAYRRVAQAIERGFLRNITKDGRGRAMALLPEGDLPDETGILPAPSELSSPCTCALPMVDHVHGESELDGSNTCAPVHESSQDETLSSLTDLETASTPVSPDLTTADPNVYSRENPESLANNRPMPPRCDRHPFAGSWWNAYRNQWVCDGCKQRFDLQTPLTYPEGSLNVSQDK